MRDFYHGITTPRQSIISESGFEPLNSPPGKARKSGAGDSRIKIFALGRPASWLLKIQVARDRKLIAGAA